MDLYTFLLVLGGAGLVIMALQGLGGGHGDGHGYGEASHGSGQAPNAGQRTTGG